MPPTDLIGIDLGTTNCAVAHLDAYGKPVVLPSAQGRNIVPSVVQLRADGSALVGDEAKQEVALEAANTAQFFKRDMGTDAVYAYRGRTYTPVTLSAEVLRKLKADAEAALGHPVRRAVITVPAYFQDAARLATKEAGRLAGLDVLQVINEPTAAALAYGLGNRQGRERVLVYDLGGGTFDVTLVELHDGALRVLATDGNHFLGGKDWDDRLMRHVCEAFEAEHGVDPLEDAYAFQEILVRVEEAKKTLSERSRATVLLNCLGKMARVEVTRAQFEDLTRDLLDQTETLVCRVLADAGVESEGVDGVLMVGGSTRMPACGALVQRLFGKPPRTTLNPDECVALGAAIQGALTLEGTTPPTSATRLLPARVQDVMSHSLGMIAVSADESRYLNSILIPKNRPVPSSESRPFKATMRGSQRSVSVYVTQGEDDAPANCTFVGKYVVAGIEPEPGGAPVLDISYAYDASGIVTVTAVQRTTKRTLTVTKEALPADMSWLQEPPGKATTVVPKTIYLAIDLSGSMAGWPLEEAQTAMQAFVSNCDMGHMSLGVIAFSDRVRIVERPCQDARRLERAIASLEVSLRLGWGNAGHPFDVALSELSDAPGQRFVLVLADGVWDDQPKAIARAKACHAAGIDVIAIGFGGADDRFLRAIASTDEGSIFTQNLTGAFENIAQVLVEGGDRLALRRG